MNKSEYLASIELYFKNMKVAPEDINQVSKEYEALYDEALEFGYNHQEIVNRLGLPKAIYSALKNDLNHISDKRDKIISITPLLAVIIYMILGFLFGLWHPGWLVFLLVPVVSTVVENDENKLTPISLFLAVIIYMVLGFLFGFWHPGWLVFSLVPVVSIVVENDGNKLAPVSLFLAIISFILIGYINSDFYTYGAVIFVIPFILFIFEDGFNAKSLSLGILVFITALIQQIYGHITLNWSYTWFIYLIPATYALYTGNITIQINGVKDYKKIGEILLVIIFYIIFSMIVPNSWVYSWVLLLRIPLILKSKSKSFKDPTVFMPFITVIIFFVLGFSFGLWNIAWLAFLLIPIVSILTDK